MSGISGSPQQGAFYQFQVHVSQEVQPQPQPPENRWETLKKCIPTSQEGWREARENQNFTTPAEINKMVKKLIRLDQSLPSNLRRFVNVAIFCVEREEKGEDEAHRRYEQRAGANISGRSIRNYASIVRGFIPLMDQVFPTLRHRAFEAALLYMPLGLLPLADYKKDPERFKSCFSPIEIIPEEHASQALYLPFIIAYRYPDYNYEAICKALDTNTLNKSEYDKFCSVRQNEKPVPYVLPYPKEPDSLPSSTKDRYDPIRDIWTKEDGNNPVTVEQGATVGVFDIHKDGYKSS